MANRIKSNRLLTWMHPSFRDLVIEHLREDAGARSAFLAACSVDGVLMALATASGSAGDVNYPLLVGPADWKVLSDRIPQVWKDCSDWERERLFSGLREAVAVVGTEPATSPKPRKHLISLAYRVLSTARASWDAAGTAIEIALLRRFFELSVLVEPLVPAPNLAPSWEEFWGAVARISRKWTNVADVDLAPVRTWLEFVAIVENNEPRALRQVGFPDDQIETLMEILRALEHVVDVKSEPNNKSDAEEAIGSLYHCRKVVASLGEYPQLKTLADSVGETAKESEEWLEEFVHENWPEQDEQDDDDRRLAGGFDLETFLEDL